MSPDSWAVRLYKVDGKTEITLATSEHPSRAACADTLRKYPKAYITRDQYARTYNVKVG